MTLDGVVGADFYVWYTFVSSRRNSQRREEEIKNVKFYMKSVAVWEEVTIFASNLCVIIKFMNYGKTIIQPY
jgi:uncharacterized membrane-anchored protein